MRKVTVTLGGREFEIGELPTRKNQKWREDLGEVLEPVVALLEQTPGMAIPTSVQDVQAEPDSVVGLVGLVRQVSGLLIGSMDQVLGLLLAYSPELKKEAEWIGDNAYDSEILSAFTKVLGLAYPFGQMVNALRQLEKVGQSQQQT